VQILAPPTHRGGSLKAAQDAPLVHAVLQTVAYADVFDYPLTADEVHRYLIGHTASRGTVRGILSNGRLVPSLLSRQGRYFTLCGREAAVDTRRQRAAVSADLWRRAVRYGRLLGNLPFVRMVAVTGALAMDNVADGDIDYLIVTEPGRLWLCRALVVAVVRLASRRGVTLCPNYFLSERVLELEERNLFTAHEVAQMVPIFGLDRYEQFRVLNRWTEAFLPNASGSPRRLAASGSKRGLRWLELPLRSRMAGPLERWEMSRKIKKLSSHSAEHAEAAFDVDWCKGHFGDHGQSTLRQFEERMRALEAQLA
jgi:hypothetical protein